MKAKMLFNEEGRQFTDDVVIPHEYILNPLPFLPTDKFYDLESFYEVVDQIIGFQQEREGVFEEERVAFRKSWINQKLDEQPGQELITASLNYRRPAALGATGNFRNPKSILVGEYQVTDYPNHLMRLSHRILEHSVQFSCWSAYPHLADARALWLERLLLQYAWAFEQKGVDKWTFAGRGPDQVQKTSEQVIYQRMLTFTFHLSELEIVARPVIRNFNFNVTLKKE